MRLNGLPLHAMAGDAGASTRNGTRGMLSMCSGL